MPLCAFWHWHFTSIWRKQLSQQHYAMQSRYSNARLTLTVSSLTSADWEIWKTTASAPWGLVSGSGRRNGQDGGEVSQKRLFLIRTILDQTLVAATGKPCPNGITIFHPNIYFLEQYKLKEELFQIKHFNHNWTPFKPLIIIVKHSVQCYSVWFGRSFSFWV